MDLTVVLQQMLMLLGMMAIGFLACKLNLIDELGSRYLTGIVLNICLPCLSIDCFLSGNITLSNWDVIQVLLVSTLTYGLLILAAYVLTPLLQCPPGKREMFLYMITFGNVGFMGFPLTVAIFGQDKLVYAIIFNMLFNLLSNSLGLIWVAASNGKKVLLQPRLFLNAPFVSAVIAMGLFFCHVQLPECILNVCSPIGDMTTPMAMLILGAAIGQMPLKSLFGEWRVYPFTAIKLFALPVFVWFVLRHMPFISRDLADVMIVLAATPVATNATMLCIRYGGDKALAARGIFFTTILCVITIPLVAMVLC